MTRTTIVLGLVVAAGVVGVFAVKAWPTPTPDDPPRVPAAPPMLPPATEFAADRAGPAGPFVSAPLDLKRARKYLTELCDIGPRVSGSPGMAKQQALVTKHFTAHGAKVVRQEFVARARSKPNDPVGMTNLVASWHPDRANRVILCCHYDTRPAAHEEPDPAGWRKPFVSANDGTAGVALFMELAHHLKDLPTAAGVDVVLFDGEEYILDPGAPPLRDGDDYFHGSRHFAAEYTKQRARGGVKYSAAVLLDLCCGTDARIAIEGYSYRYAPALVGQVWGVAKAAGAKSFKSEVGFARAHDVQDDHLALNQAGIPAVDIIDFDYAHWHKLSDTPDKVSDAQMNEVGQVLVGWLKSQK